MTWEPEQYLFFSDERGLPFRRLLAAAHHLLEGNDPVLEWAKGTTMRPVLVRLDDDGHDYFTTA